MKIVLATQNEHKAREIREILEGTDIELLTLGDFPSLTLPPETGSTLIENAVAKARYVARETGLAALADDSGLEVDRLEGRPGVLSARYAGEAATDSENIAKLLSELEGVPTGSRTARFRCVVALVQIDGQVETFDGNLEGLITDQPTGTNGFGYDPVFFIPEEERTAAQLTPDEKNALSHRGRALEKLKHRLTSQTPS